MIPLLYVILLHPDPDVLLPPYPDNFEGIIGITQGSIYKWSYHDNNEMVIISLRPGTFCNIRYPSEAHLKLKSREFPFAHNLFFSYPIVLQFCT